MSLPNGHGRDGRARWHDTRRRQTVSVRPATRPNSRASRDSLRSAARSPAPCNRARSRPKWLCKAFLFSFRVIHRSRPCIADTEALRAIPPHCPIHTVDLHAGYAFRAADSFGSSSSGIGILVSRKSEEIDRASSKSVRRLPDVRDRDVYVIPGIPLPPDVASTHG